MRRTRRRTYCYTGPDCASTRTAVNLLLEQDHPGQASNERRHNDEEGDDSKDKNHHNR